MQANLGYPFPGKTQALEPQTADSQLLIRQLARLVEVSVQLNSTLDPDQLLQFIIRAAADLLNCEAASILLFDEKRGELCFTSATGSESKELAAFPVPLDGSIAGTIFRKNCPLIINDVNCDPRHYALVGQRLNFEVRSLLGVPMCIRKQTTGVLEALNKRSGEFAQTDVRLLEIIASQAAVAIHNARLVQALQTAYDGLSRIDKIKSDFISVASHELRTPLGIILGYASFLKEESQGKLSEHASRVMDSALQMRSLIQAMTNMNLLQMGSLPLDLRIVPIQRVLELAHAEILSAVEAKGQTLILDLPQELLYVCADVEKLEQAILNLLNNAVRFTEDGGLIQINLTSSSDEILVEIKDSGIGIPQDELENIFKEFYQVEDAMTRRYGGMGLGLAIARGLIVLHDGRLWAESQGLGQGASFKVGLRRAMQ
jgi:signal transduction histidine kinase